MIPLTLAEIATVVGGSVAGDPAVTVTAPAVLDGRISAPGGLFVAFAGERVDGHDFAAQAGAAGAVAVLGSRPTALPTVVVTDAEAALQALARHVVGILRERLAVVAITGSQGKTSTKDLLTAVLASAGPTVANLGNLNNELGVPVTMLRADAGTRYLVLEMGARRVGDIARLTGLVAPDVSIVLNVGKAHLGEFGSQDAIARAKGELVQGVARGGTAVLNADDPRVAAMRSLTDAAVLSYGREEPADVRVEDLALDALGRPSFTLRTVDAAAHVDLPILGAHQALNAAGVAAAALALGLSLDAVAAALGGVALTAKRLQVRRLAGGATLLDDTYNASPGSMRSALDTLVAVDGTRRIAVLGEILELGDASPDEHRQVGAYAVGRADVVIAIGERVRPLAEGAGAVAVAVDDNAAAIEWLHENLAAGDVVLVKASHGSRLDEVANALG
ncbi:UDP-N-acetylmuramoyl-tripeptide--D-alanyl-D-alanine ligase [Galbitalea sp. SE-J8]|uniref:UDP-N-acetylmuramoyl-tripeptide--D-alanyl-D- alanine ligase n=1 Tax=Galbitalea sp. SE-J8 TaxID=3054952 RepID=UPI00259C94AA|nr:UDP-N-acetylmuramoyl-tripeptide--D-alanyl-D-alanine ligase [Galbitalea sp. SE-J8]MDM4763990.1 UDP-N-acetylmuramoyl-tripeptide--D-alanyl-D-alanine ligase [Galbitalea sp. SE-J8]